MFDKMFTKKDSPQFEARVILMRIKSIKSLNTKDLAKDVGVCATTLDRFLGHEIDVRKETFAKILEYVMFERKQLEI